MESKLEWCIVILASNSTHFFGLCLIGPELNLWPNLLQVWRGGGREGGTAWKINQSPCLDIFLLRAWYIGNLHRSTVEICTVVTLCHTALRCNYSHFVTVCYLSTSKLQILAQLAKFQPNIIRTSGNYSVHLRCPSIEVGIDVWCEW